MGAPLTISVWIRVSDLVSGYHVFKSIRALCNQAPGPDELHSCRFSIQMNHDSRVPRERQPGSHLPGPRHIIKSPQKFRNAFHLKIMTQQRRRGGRRRRHSPRHYKLQVCRLSGKSVERVTTGGQRWVSRWGNNNRKITKNYTKLFKSRGSTGRCSVKSSELVAWENPEGNLLHIYF